MKSGLKIYLNEIFNKKMNNYFSKIKETIEPSVGGGFINKSASDSSFGLRRYYTRTR